MSGELIFTIAYRSALVVMGFVTKGFLGKMEREAKRVESNPETDSIKNYKKAV